MTMDKEANDNG